MTQKTIIMHKLIIRYNKTSKKCKKNQKCFQKVARSGARTSDLRIVRKVFFLKI